MLEIDLEALFNKTKVDIYATRSEMLKLQINTEPAEAFLKKMSELLEKHSILCQDDDTICKVHSGDLFTYSYQMPKVNNVVPTVSANEKSDIPISNSSQSGEVAPSVIAHENQILSASKRRFEDD